MIDEFYKYYIYTYLIQVRLPTRCHSGAQGHNDAVQGNETKLCQNNERLDKRAKLDFEFFIVLTKVIKGCQRV